MKLARSRLLGVAAVIVATVSAGPALAVNLFIQPWGAGKPYNSGVSLSQTNGSGVPIWTETWGAVQYNQCTNVSATGGWVVTPAIDQNNVTWYGEATLRGGYDGASCARMYAVTNTGDYYGASSSGCYGSWTEYWPVSMGSVYVPEGGTLSVAADIRGRSFGCSLGGGLSRVRVFR